MGSRAATFRKFGKRLQPKRFRLHGTSRFDFFIMQIGKVADIVHKKSLKNVTCANIQKIFVGCCDRTHFKLVESDCNMRRLVYYQHFLQLQLCNYRVDTHNT